MIIKERGIKILVCGGRDYNDRHWIRHLLNTLHQDRQIVYLIVGDASGADYHALQWAVDNKVGATQYIAKWEEHGRAAGPLRNKRMLEENPDIQVVVAFPGGKGTANMVKQARAAGVPEIWYDGEGTVRD